MKGFYLCQGKIVENCSTCFKIFLEISVCMLTHGSKAWRCTRIRSNRKYLKQLDFHLELGHKTIHTQLQTKIIEKYCTKLYSFELLYLKYLFILLFYVPSSTFQREIFYHKKTYSTMLNLRKTSTLELFLRVYLHVIYITICSMFPECCL